MAWTYDVTKFNDNTLSTYPPATNGQLMNVRLLIQDNRTARQLLQDEEIEQFINSEANIYMAAAACCDSLVAIAGTQKSKKISEFQITYDAGFYRELAAQLRARGQGHQTPYAGGISIADKLAQQENTDWVPPAVSRGLDDNLGAPSPAANPTNPLVTP